MDRQIAVAPRPSTNRTTWRLAAIALAVALAAGCRPAPDSQQPEPDRPATTAPGPIYVAPSVPAAVPELVTVGTDEFTVAMVQPGVGGTRRPLQAAQSIAELDALTRSYGYIFEWVPDAFDFERHIVVAFNAPSNGCIPNVDRFDPHPGRTITPHFAPAAGPGDCDDIEQWPLYLVTIDRAAVAPWFVLELPGSDRIGDAPRRLRIDVQPTAAEAAGLQPLGWRLLTVVEQVTAPRSLATDDTTHARQWAALGYATTPPAVDLMTEVVLAFTITDGGCGDHAHGVVPRSAR